MNVKPYAQKVVNVLIKRKKAYNNLAHTKKITSQGVWKLNSCHFDTK